MKHRIHFLVCCLLLCAGGAFCADYSGPVAGVTINGLKKTRESYVQGVLKKYVGMDSAAIDLHAVETDLQKEGLFSSINVSLVQDGPAQARLVVDVTEKIYFLALPFGMVSNGTFGIGAAVLDMNAFGVKDTFVFGGMYSPDSKMLMSMFSQPARDVTHPGFSTSLLFRKSEQTITNVSDKDVFEYDSLALYASASVHEKVTDFLTLSLGGGYEYNKLDDDYDILKTYHKGSLTGGLGFHVTDYNGWFLSGFSADVQGRLSYTSRRHASQSVSLGMDYQYPVLPRLRLLAHAAAFYGHDLEIPALEGRTSINVLILPQEFRSDRLMGANSGVEWAFLRTKFGILSAYGLYEVAMVRNWDDENVFCHGPKVGAKVYLSTIALPAVDIAFAYNIPERLPLFAFSLGMSF